MVEEVMNKGFSLIEVLISILLLSIALIGIDALELNSLRISRETYYLSVATNQMQSIADRLKVFSNNNVLQSEIDDWNRENKNILPQGRGQVSGIFPFYQIAVFWGD